MSHYRDSKGITHLTESGRDSANNSYVREERASRELMESHQIAQTEILQEQASILYAQAQAQKWHNQKMEMIALAQREEQWLMNSDAQGRFEFLQKKFYSELISTQADYVFSKLKLRKYMNSNRTDGLIASLNNLIQSMTAVSKFKVELSKLKSELSNEESKKMGCGCLIFVLIIVGISFPPLILLAVILGYINYPDKEYKWKIEKMKSAIDLLDHKIIKNENKLKDKLGLSKNAFQEWHTEAKKILELTIEKANKLGLISKKQIALLTELEKEYPPLLRVDWSAITPDFLAKSTNAILDDIQKVAELKLLNTDFLFAELSLNSEDDAYKALTGNPEILAKILTLDS